MDTASFGNVVGGLFLGKVGDVAGHGGSNDEGSSFALAEVVTHGFGAVECAGQVSVDDFPPCLHACVQNSIISRLPCVSDEDVDFPKVFDNILDKLLYVFPVADLAFVGLAFDAKFLRKLFGVVFAAFGTGSVGDGEVGTHFGTAAGSLNTDANGAGGTGYDDDFAFEAEEVMDGVGGGDVNGHGDGVGEFSVL